MGGGLGGNGGVGGGRPDVGTCDPPETLKELGVACGCHEECDSGSCVDGVCCSSACEGTCQACNVPGKMGNCSPVPAGMAPVVAGQCTRDEVSTCGFDGTCDGNGGCRRYPDGTECEKGMCDGASVKGAKACREGECVMGSNVVCAPFGCDPEQAQCRQECTDNTQCAPGQQCKDGSCGKKNLGAKCEAASECESGFCADGVCCNTKCDGGCLSCNQPEKMGECAPVAQDQPDPHGVCKDNGATSCGTSGVCDGKGGCAKYGAGTVCRAQRCEGANQVSPSTCDGMGECKPGAQVSCPPYTCSGNACVRTCMNNSQCTGGNVCINGSCGKRGLGQKCDSNTECGSNFCVDGVCCDGACNGQCRFCASSQAPGWCINVPASTPDPRRAAGVTDSSRICSPQSQSSCGRNGMCNGNGGCQLWPNNTMCANQSCSSSTNTYSPARLCDGAGTCRSQPSLTCAPYKCNANSCGTACGSNNDCVSPNECINGRCGLKPPGALCGGDSECGSNFCRQGICCQTDCRGSCFSCALMGSRGVCTAVPAGGQDPAGTCRADGVSTCDRDGTCDGSGKCRLYASGQECAPSTCSAGTATERSTCDGKGDCVRGSERPCGGYRCNVEGTACYESCVDSNQCVLNQVCLDDKTCGKKPNGGECTASTQCLSGICKHGVCCNTACDGVCKSCGVAGSRGTCTNVVIGQPDVDGRCEAAPNTCGNNGLCNGSGACANYDASTICRNPSCPAGTSTETLSATCDGNGNCPAAQTRDCDTALCDPGTNSCYKGCTDSAQCVAPNVCSMMSCGLKGKGVSCASHGECASGKCANGVCCVNVPAGQQDCGACKACNLGATLGECAPLAAGTGGAGSCASTECGVQAQCDGSGNCLANAPAGKPCGATSCSGNSVQTMACNGSGTCAVNNTTSCGFFTCAAGVCKSPCTAPGDCVAGRVCANGECVIPKDPPGASCTTADTCSTAFCSPSAADPTKNVCCNAACTGACKGCDGSGNCQDLAENTVDSRCNADTANQCRYGICGAGGVCKLNSCNSTCSADGNSVTGSVCNGQNTNPPACMVSTTACVAYKCAGGTCLEACQADAQCQSGFYCQTSDLPVGSKFKCIAKRALGGSCSRDEHCSMGSCVKGPGNEQGICCATACPVSGGVCGNDGYCSDNGLSCRKAPATIECSRECIGNGTKLKIALCDGNGNCPQEGTVTDCELGCDEGPPAMCQLIVTVP